MPFIIRTVEPEYLCRNESVLTSSNVLEEQNKQTWINYLRQMSSISTQSNDILELLSSKINNISQRSADLCARIQNINNSLPGIQFPLEEFVNEDGFTPSSYQIIPKLDGQSIGQLEMPSSLSTVYQACHPKPEFHLLDKYRTDGKTTSSFYSDPSFFNRAWVASIQKDVESRNRKRLRSKAVALHETKNIADVPNSRLKDIVLHHNKADISQTSKSKQSSNRVSTSSSVSMQKKPTIDLPPLPPPPGVTYKTDSFPAPPDDFSCDSSDIPPPPPSNFSSPSASSLNASLQQKPTSSYKSSTPAYQSPHPSKPTDYSSAIYDDSVPPPPPLFDLPSPPPTPSFDDPPPPSFDAPPPPPQFNASAPVTSPASKPRPAPQKVEVDDNPRDQFLDSIRLGKNLRKTQQPVKAKPVEFENEVAAMLSQRINAMSKSDSEEGEVYDNEWD